MVSACGNRGIHRTLLTAAGWLILYFVLVATPVFILLIGPRPPGTGFWWDVSLALGYSAMGMMGIQFALTARFRRATAPFGIDIIYYFHRYLAVAALGLIVLHVVIVTVVNPAAAGLINPWTSPWYLNLGIAALLLFAAVMITSLWRKGLHIPYGSTNDDRAHRQARTKIGFRREHHELGKIFLFTPHWVSLC